MALNNLLHENSKHESCLQAKMAAASRPRKRILTPEKIERLLQQSDLSDISDESDDGWPVIADEGESDGDDSDLDEDIPDNEVVESTKGKTKPLIWKRKKMVEKFQVVEDIFDVPEPLSPLTAFFEYLNVSFFEEVAVQTNLYSVQQKHKSVNTNVYQ